MSNEQQTAEPAALQLNDGLGAAAEAREPLHGIAANWFHDEGAFAQCGDCGRYTLNPGALWKKIPCECGSTTGWSGSFVRPGPGSKWSGLVQPASA